MDKNYWEFGISGFRDGRPDQPSVSGPPQTAEVKEVKAEPTEPPHDLLELPVVAINDSEPQDTSPKAIDVNKSDTVASVESRSTIPDVADVIKHEFIGPPGIVTNPVLFTQTEQTTTETQAERDTDIPVISNVISLAASGSNQTYAGTASRSLLITTKGTSVESTPMTLAWAPKKQASATSTQKVMMIQEANPASHHAQTDSVTQSVVPYEPDSSAAAAAETSQNSSLQHSPQDKATGSLSERSAVKLPEADHSPDEQPSVSGALESSMASDQQPRIRQHIPRSVAYGKLTKKNVEYFYCDQCHVRVSPSSAANHLMTSGHTTVSSYTLPDYDGITDITKVSNSTVII